MRNSVREKMCAGERTLGTFFELGTGNIAECMGFTGLDYIIIDTRIFAGADEGDRVFFPQLNRAFKLDVRGEAEDDIFIKWEVSEVAP